MTYFILKDRHYNNTFNNTFRISKLYFLQELKFYINWYTIPEKIQCTFMTPRTLLIDYNLSNMLTYLKNNWAAGVDGRWEFISHRILEKEKS